MEVFFYGLFMDEAILTKSGVTPTNPRIGCLKNYALKIGNRASLLPSEGERAYGIVMTVNNETIEGLYTEPSVADYIPETVEVVLDKNELVKATCYNLPTNLLSGTNQSYARALHKLGMAKGLPLEYLSKIKEMTK